MLDPMHRKIWYMTAYTGCVIWWLWVRWVCGRELWDAEGVGKGMEWIGIVGTVIEPVYVY